jgi:hypothetical protein
MNTVLFQLKKMSRFGFEGLQYCLKVSFLDDWNYRYYCSKGLVENYKKVKTPLPLSQVVKIQEYLNKLEDIEKYNIATGFKFLAWEYIS